MKIRIFHKFVAVMLAISVVPLSLLGWRLINMGQRGVQTAILELHLNIAEKIAYGFHSRIASADTSLRFVLDALGSMDWENKQTLLASYLETNPDMLEVSVLSPGGQEVLKAISPSVKAGGVLASYAADPGFMELRKTGRRVINFDLAGGIKKMILYYPFGKAMALRAELDFSGFTNPLDSHKLGSGGFPVILDSAGRAIDYPRDLDPEEVKDAGLWQISRTALTSLASGSAEFEDSRGRKFLGAYSPIPEIGGTVIVRQPKEVAFSYALFMKKEAFYLVIVFVLLAVAAAWLMSRNLSKPITELTGVAASVAGGDFSRTVTVSTADELRDLAETFNNMVRRLKTYSDMQVDRIIREQKNTEAVLFSTEDGIVMVDHERKVQLANRRARSVLGLSAEGPLEGKALLEIISDAKMKALVLEVLENKKEDFFAEFEVDLQHSRRFFKCFSRPIVAPGKAVEMGTLVAFYDITLDRELARIKDEFLHSITHDLRNPMGAIKGFVEFLLKEIPGPINESQKKMLTSIDRASFRLLGMINNILDIAKMEAGKMELKLTSVNLNEMGQRVIELMESMGQRKNIKFVLEAERTVTLKADSGLMERMFTNLIGNAIKFAPENGVITLGLEEGEGQVTAFVQDTGDGVPLEYLDKIFEKFEQVTGQKAGGTGLGLTICKHIAAAHLGRIWAESEPGKGSKFIFTVPKDLAAGENGRVLVKSDKRVAG
ncbi:MAG: hypothetical protein A2X34_06670 [Elusimicrobia bacterium GWC2_51_8]|nr:MAG: hypothetical protein A2X34_06670 [Elusimicrobia bacterium GWC2_51_8]OGR84990.1 MAG: hypothetical protein A2021_08390 [Elusimicrobia bacterium GWF2_52_66]HAF96418.1 hypothetical protein [Elusimicrobiota bacterium]